MPVVSPDKPCNRVFERIFSGELKDQVIFRSKVHQVFAALAIKQATKGHSIVVPTECRPRVDLLPREARRSVDIVDQATGLWLQAAFEPDYVGAMTAGKQVAHAHRHRAPSYTSRDWLRVMGADDPQSFVVMSDDEAAEVYARATFHPKFAETVEAELAGAESMSIDQMAEMAYDLALPISTK